MTGGAIPYALEAVQWTVVGILIGISLRPALFRRGGPIHRRDRRD